MPPQKCCTVIALDMAFKCKPGCELMSATCTLGKHTHRMYSCVEDYMLCAADTNLVSLGTMLTHLFGGLELLPTLRACALRCSVIQWFSLWGLKDKPTDEAPDLPQHYRRCSDVKWVRGLNECQRALSLFSGLRSVMW